MCLPLACAERRPSSLYGEVGEVAARFVDAVSPQRGHLLRRTLDPANFATAAVTDVDVLVVGGGVSGLAACWKLKRAGVERVFLVELADRLGGDAVAGQAGALQFPWGAHYINVPPAEADCVHEVLCDLDVISGYDAAGRPLVSPDHLLRWPAERLWADGDWVEGLDPFADAGQAEMDDLQAFEDDMLRWTLHRGRDGRRAFAMPLAYSTADAHVRQLDGQTMAEYSKLQGWRSPRLAWLIDQACKDDYGSLAGDVSAWAGIHYFACRFYDRRVRDDYPSDTLTWPQGNQFLADGLARELSADERWLATAVVGLHSGDTSAEALCVHAPTGEPLRVRARSVVYAGKLHTAPHVVTDLPAAQRQAIAQLNYVPWLVAAVKLTSARDLVDSWVPSTPSPTPLPVWRWVNLPLGSCSEPRGLFPRGQRGRQNENAVKTQVQHSGPAAQRKTYDLDRSKSRVATSGNGRRPPDVSLGQSQRRLRGR